MDNSQEFKFSPSVWIVPTFLLFVIWAVFFAELRYNLNFAVHGVYPRTVSGLQGIIFSPFIHGDFNHLINNSITLFILIVALIYFYRNISLKVMFYGIIMSGFLTWIIGRNSYHIGASGLIYVLVSFIFFKGLITKYYRLMALSLAVVMTYGGLIWYVFPEVDNSISWEGHLAGLITGFVFALLFKTPDYKKEIRYEWEKPDFNPEEDKFMRHFDENGNFISLSIAEDDEIKTENAMSEIRYVYEYKESPKESDDNG